MGTAQEFEVKPVPSAAPGADFTLIAAFASETSDLMRRVAGAGQEIGSMRDRLRHMRAALLQAPRADTGLFARLDDLGRALQDLQTRLNGDQIRQRLNESSAPSIRGRVGRVSGGHWNTRQTPTSTQRRNIEIARGDFTVLLADVAIVEDVMAQLESDLEAAGAPWTPGRRVPR